MTEELNWKNEENNRGYCVGFSVTSYGPKEYLLNRNHAAYIILLRSVLSVAKLISMLYFSSDNLVVHSKQYPLIDDNLYEF